LEDQQGQSILTALFGALYTLAKEKINDSASIAMLAMWIDFLMIFTLLLMPEYPWKVDYNLWYGFIAVNCASAHAVATMPVGPADAWAVPLVRAGYSKCSTTFRYTCLLPTR
jgi:hypothetical protein